MARPVVGNPFDGQIGTVAPTARPVDTYVRGVVKSSPFEALSNTLSNLEKKAIPALQREQQRRAEAEYAEGQQLWADTRVQFGKAVKDGTIEAGESPYLRKGYRMANLNVLSANYANDLKAEMEKKKLYRNGNPAAIEEFITNFQASYADKNGLADFKQTETAEVFLPNAMKANIAFKSSWRTKHASYMTTKIYDAFANNINAYTYSITDQTIPMEQRTKLAAGLQEFITAQAAQADIDGLDRTKIGNIIGNSLRLSALENKSLAPLDLMDTIKLGTAPLASTPENRLKNLQTRATVAGLITTAEETADAERQEAIDVGVTTQLEIGQVALKDLLSDNPSVVAKANQNIDLAIVELEKIVGEDDTGVAAQEIVNIQKLRQTFLNYNDEEEGTGDAVAYYELVTELQDVTDNTTRIEMIAQAVKDGVATKTQAKTLHNEGYTSKDDSGYARVSASTSVVQRMFNNSIGLMKGETSYLQGVQKAEAAELQGRIRTALVDDMYAFIAEFEAENEKPPSDRQLEMAARAKVAELIKEEADFKAQIEAETAAQAQALKEEKERKAAVARQEAYDRTIKGKIFNYFDPPAAVPTF